MGIKSLLKNEGINVIRELNIEEIKTIAKDIAIKLCLAFPEHNLSRTYLYESFSSIKMYLANLPKDFSGAKYILENNSIYFNKDVPFEDIPSTAMHECIHYIQYVNSDLNFGLYTSPNNLALNEAAVQLMASEANMNEVIDVKYFDISLKTNTPNYYPLECVLLNEITYFTGTYPLYNSVLFGNDVFKNTFSIQFNKKFYTFFTNKLNTMLLLEDELNSYVQKLSSAKNKGTIKNLNNIIKNKKQKIKNLFFQIQNHIIEICFNYEFDKTKTLTDIHDFKNKLYKFKNIIGFDNNYTFYNDYYCSMMNIIERKKEYIKEHGPLSLPTQESTALMIIDTKKNKITFAKTLFSKLKKLLKTEISTDYIN